MPRASRRSVAARARWARRPVLPVSDTGVAPAETFTAANLETRRGGTGARHRAKRWPVSQLTGREYRLQLPPPDSDKRFVLIVGASQLRPFVEGLAAVPSEYMSFGFLSVPAASAKELSTELRHVSLPRLPDAVCILATCGDLVSGAIEAASEGFGDLLRTALERCPEVYVHDFVPRLTADPGHQELMRQELCRVAGNMGIYYFSAAEHFPFDCPDLWCGNGMHLSDTGGSMVLGELLEQAACRYFESAPVMCWSSPSPARSLSPAFAT